METMGGAATRRAALLVATLSSFLTPFMASAINVALPSVARELRLSTVAMGWVATIYLLATAIVLLPSGRIADMTGRKRVFAIGISIFTLATLACGLSPSAAALLVARVAQGIGSAMIFSTGVAILTLVFQPSERGQVMGLNVAATYTGLSAGPYAGGLLVNYLGWRSVFFATVPLGLLALVVLLRSLRGEWAEARGERLDGVGGAVYSLALLAGMLGLSLLPGWPGWVLLVAGGLGIVGFIGWERRTPCPLLDVRLFQYNRPFAYSNLAALINYSATSAVGYMLSLYLQTVRGLSPQRAGLVLVSQPVMMALFSPLAGRLADRIEPRMVASAGMGLTAAGLAMLIPLGVGSPLAYVILCQLALGIGFAFFSSPNVSAIMGSVARRHYGVASAALATMRLLGQMLSIGLATLFLALMVGRGEIQPEHHGSFMVALRVTFTVFAALCGAGVLASLARGNLRPAEAAANCRVETDDGGAD